MGDKKEAGLPAMITFTTVNEKSCDGYSRPVACNLPQKNGAEDAKRRHYVECLLGSHVNVEIDSA